MSDTINAIAAGINALAILIALVGSLKLLCERLRRKSPPESVRTLQLALDALVAVEGCASGGVNLPECPVCHYGIWSSEGNNVHGENCVIGLAIEDIRRILHPGVFFSFLRKERRQVNV